MTQSPVLFTLASTDDGEFITVYVPGREPLPATAQSHSTFDQIKALCLDSLNGKPIDADEVSDLFDIGKAVIRKFQRLTDRISVKGESILLDGDPVHGTLQEQILDFLDKGEDFGPLVNFYEKLATNPLGNVQEGLFDWIVGQRESGPLTITPDGDVIGYKSVHTRSPEWREGGESVWTPSRRGEGVVNGVDVASDKYIEQREGDVVEMPRSKVLNAPSQDCGDGLHIGNYSYAERFQGDTVLLVKFSPRDIVSLPDRNSSWKLRVCRYTVVGATDKALDTPLYLTASDIAEQYLNSTQETESALADALDLDVALPGDLAKHDRVVDVDGDVGTVVVGPDEDGDVLVEYDDESYGTDYVAKDDLVLATETQSDDSRRIHGKGGPTSYAAKGRGINPAQDRATGQFKNGRPGSDRSGTTGRFVAKS